MEISSERCSRGRRLLQDRGVVKNERVSVSSLSWENKNEKIKGSQSKEFKMKVSKEATPASTKLADSAKDHGKKSYPTICDLCPEDKKRVRELVEQVARLGSEKENLIGEMAKERDAYQGLLETLKTQCHEMSEKKNNLEAELKLFQTPAITTAASMVPDHSQSSSKHNPFPSIHHQPQQLFCPDQPAPQKHYSINTQSLQGQVGPSKAGAPASHLHQLATSRSGISPPRSSSTFASIHLSPSRHFKNCSTSYGVSRSDAFASSQPPHPSKCGHPVSAYHHTLAGNEPRPPTRQRIRFPSGMSSISSISATDDDSDNSSCFTGNLPFLRPHGHAAKGNVVGMKVAKIKHPMEVSERTAASAGNIMTMSTASSSEMEATSGGVPAAAAVANTPTVASPVPHPRADSHSTEPLAVDSSTQTLNVESKAIQTERETSLHKPGREPDTAVCAACHGLSAGASSFMPSAYVPPCEMVVQQDPDRTPDMQCRRGNPSSQSYASLSGSTHHSVDHRYGGIKASSLGHTSHTMYSEPGNFPSNLSCDVLDKTIRPGSRDPQNSPHSVDVTISPLSGVATSVMTHSYTSIPHAATSTSGRPCRTTTHTSTAPAADHQGFEMEQDMLLVSGLLNADNCEDTTNLYPLEGSHLQVKQEGKCPHTLQLAASPPKTSSLDIAFALNSHQPPSPVPHPSSSTVHISIGTPTSHQPLQQQHGKQHHSHSSQSPSAQLTPPPPTYSGHLASSLNQYMESDDLPVSMQQERQSALAPSDGEDYRTATLEQTATDTHSSMEDTDNSLISNLFFIQ